MITNKKYNINGINTNIVLISDIHYYNKKDIKRLNKVYDNINKIKPNFICIPGDILDSAKISDIDLFISWLTKLSYISKIIITLGNHEYYVSKKESIFKLNEEHINKLSNINNVYLLRNNNIIIDNINFIGLELPIDYYMKYGESIESFNDNIKNIKGNKKYYNILLCHSPVCVCNKDIINKLNVEKSKVYGIGDSIHDVKMLSLAGHKFGIDPKGDFKEFVDIVIEDDISDVIKYL